MFTSNVGAWLEAIGLIGFVAANVAAVFVVLYRALGMPDDPKPAPPADRGAMTDAGVPYVPGPERTGRSTGGRS